MPSDANKLVHKYVDEVINGKSSRPIGELERLAVERYLRDRDQAKSKGFKLDEVEAARRIDFAKMCGHTAGEYARRRFDLQGFQAFKLWNIFGWYVEPGVRRFTESYDGMARKGAKTEVAGVIANSIYLMDDIEGAEVYFAATKSKQAMVTFRVARKMMSFFKRIILHSPGILLYRSTRSSIMKPIHSLKRLPRTMRSRMDTVRFALSSMNITRIHHRILKRCCGQEWECTGRH